MRTLDRDARWVVQKELEMIRGRIGEQVLMVHGHARSKLVADEAMREGAKHSKKKDKSQR